MSELMARYLESGLVVFNKYPSLTENFKLVALHMRRVRRPARAHSGSLFVPFRSHSRTRIVHGAGYLTDTDHYVELLTVMLCIDHCGVNDFGETRKAVGFSYIWLAIICDWLDNSKSGMVRFSQSSELCSEDWENLTFLITNENYTYVVHFGRGLKKSVCFAQLWEWSRLAVRTILRLLALCVDLSLELWVYVSISLK